MPEDALVLRISGADGGRLRALRLLVERFECRGDWLTVPLHGASPEEVLAACSAVGLVVRQSRVERAAPR